MKDDDSPSFFRHGTPRPRKGFSFLFSFPIKDFFLSIAFLPLVSFFSGQGGRSLEGMPPLFSSG